MYSQVVWIWRPVVFLHCLLPSVLNQNLSVNLKLLYWTRLVGQWVPGSSLNSLSYLPHWNYRLPCSSYIKEVESLNSSPCACITSTFLTELSPQPIIFKVVECVPNVQIMWGLEGIERVPKTGCWMTVYSLFFNGTLKSKTAVVLHQGLKYHLGLLQVEGHSLVVSSSDDSDKLGEKFKAVA